MTALITIFGVLVGIAVLLFGIHFVLKARAKREAAPAGEEIAADRKWESSMQKYDKVTRLTVTYVFLSILCLLSLFPFIWMVLTSLKTVAEATNTAKLVLFPAQPQWHNYIDVFEKLDIFTGMKNTMIVEISTIPFTVFVSALVAFAFSKMRLHHKNFWLLFLMSGLMVPGAATLLPTYKIYLMLNLTDTLWPLILPSLFGNVSLIFFFIQFQKGIPNELFEAARLDGAGYFKSFLLIMLPNMLLPIVCQVVFAFVSHWNDFFGPSIYLTSDNTKTLQVKLYSYATWSDKPMLYTGSFVTCIPLFVLYLCFQKCFVGSLAISGIKG